MGEITDRLRAWAQDRAAHRQAQGDSQCRITEPWQDRRVRQILDRAGQGHRRAAFDPVTLPPA